MSRNRAKRAAQEIADGIIAAARASASDPITWVTGNQYWPPMRSFAAAEIIWQLPGNSPDAWHALCGRVDELLEAANVALECPDNDNSLYAVDLNRWEYVEAPDGEYLQDDWQLIIR